MKLCIGKWRGRQYPVEPGGCTGNEDAAEARRAPERLREARGYLRHAILCRHFLSVGPAVWARAAFRFHKKAGPLRNFGARRASAGKGVSFFSSVMPEGFCVWMITHCVLHEYLRCGGGPARFTVVGVLEPGWAPPQKPEKYKY